MRERRSIALACGASLVCATLAACGGSGSSSREASTEPLVTPSKSAKTASSSSSVPAVAYVDGTPIPKASYEHWLAVDRALGVTDSPQHHALGFLISSSWILGEAVQRNISVGAGEVQKRLASLEKQQFPKAGQLQSYLRKSHQTKADLLARVKVELLQARISEQVAANASSNGAREAALASFQKRFAARWKAVTTCKPGYVMEDCREYRGAPEPQSTGAPGSSPSSSSGSSGVGSSSGSSGVGSSSSASSSGEVYSTPGAFAISSPAFERNGQISAKYTCAGAGISPPLQWSKVPKGASELVLFIIDDTSSGSEGGIRWVLGGIAPSSTGVAAGATPPGAIVGTNTAGKATYSPICPAKGKTDTIEFVMYALKKPITLSPGFQPSTAEAQYGSTKDILGEAAVTYGLATGP
jgi:phosphatidylethanolamine-binding protein (PEBP) family uncharacterized protein